jgi:ferredoxin-type protein NapH
VSTANASLPTLPDRRGFHWTRWRRVVQVVLLLFFLVLPVTNLLWQREVIGTLASLQLGPISLVDPASGLSTILAAASLSATLLTGLILPLLLALVAGPVFCSWVCPYGLVSELIDQLRKGRRPHINQATRRLRWGVLIGVLTLSAITGLPLVVLISAPRAMTVIPMEAILISSIAHASVGLLVGVLVVELLAPRRIWCRAICPVGSCLAALRTPRTLQPHYHEATCDPAACGVRCVAVCPWGLDPRHLSLYDGCTSCGKCLERCPAQPSAALRFSRPQAES